jgi:hypothetical protein
LKPKKKEKRIEERDETEERDPERRLESVKHYLWRGNSEEALEELRDLIMELECWNMGENGEALSRSDAPNAAKMLRYAGEFDTYIANNAGYIVNYGERYRNGERISTGFVESTINQVVSKRMVKKQHMQWTPRGAHLLLQVRTQVLNGD